MKRDGRRILFEGIANCRDLGGLKNADGQTIREGLLLRSAHLQNAAPDDIQNLRETFLLSEIQDLRNSDEQKELPDKPVPGAVHVDMAIFPKRQQGITHEKDLRPYQIWPPMRDLYIKLVNEAPLNHNMGRAVRRILTHDYSSGAILWHCFGGKDRCGVAAALVLSVLDVPYPVIREDYMMTNITAGRIAEQARQAVLERGGPQEEADFEYDANIARESYIDGTFDAIRETFGDPVTYLKEMGGVTDEELYAFRKNLLI